MADTESGVAGVVSAESGNPDSPTRWNHWQMCRESGVTEIQHQKTFWTLQHVPCAHQVSGPIPETFIFALTTLTTLTKHWGCGEKPCQGLASYIRQTSRHP
jgi:hypothetical protein